MRRWWSGLSQQTVNLSPLGFVGSNPTRRTTKKASLYDSLFLCTGATELLQSRVGFERRSDVWQACQTARRCPDQSERRRRLSRGRILVLPGAQ